MLALSVIAILALAAPLTLAEDDGGVVSATADMDGDGEADTTESRPDQGPGEVRINARTVGGGDGTIVLRGRDPGDRFGESVAILTRPADEVLDLFVGAPGAGATGQGEAYVFFGPFELPPGQTELIITADQADITLASYWDDDADFGRRVAPLIDFTGDGFPELRVQSIYTDTDGLDYIFTQVFRSEPTLGYNNGGELMFISIHRPCHNDGFWQYLEGDTLGDQAVTIDDFWRVAVNYGQSGAHLTRFDGDLNGDGVVDVADFDLVLNNFDTLGSLVQYALDMPAFEPNETLVLHYPAMTWAIAELGIVPIGPAEPARPVDPVIPCDLNPDCPCGGGGTVDCQVTPCAQACGGVCNPDCSTFDPCHADCNPGATCCDQYPCSSTCGGDGCGGLCANDPCLDACDPPPDCCTDSPCAPSCGGAGCSGMPCAADPCADACQPAGDCCVHNPCSYSCGGSGCAIDDDPDDPDPPGGGAGCTLLIEWLDGGQAKEPPGLYCPDTTIQLRARRKGKTGSGCSNGTWEWEIIRASDGAVVKEASGSPIEHAFSELGEYEIRLRRKDNCCGTAVHTIHIVEVRLDKVTFGVGDGFHPVRRDNNGDNYETPHWLSAKARACVEEVFCCDIGWDATCDQFEERSHPIAYTRTKPNKNSHLLVKSDTDGVVFYIDAPSLEGIYGFEARTVATRPNGSFLSMSYFIPLDDHPNAGCVRMNPPNQPKATQYCFGGKEVLLNMKGSKLPSTIDWINPLKLTWSVRAVEIGFPDNVLYLPPCVTLESKNTLYVTLDDPVGADLRYHTVLDVACKGGAGHDGSNIQAIVNGIWNQFKDRDVKRVEDGQQLKYYGSWQVPYVYANDLLGHLDANCHAWAQLMRWSLNVHSISSVHHWVYPQIPQEPSPGKIRHMAVREWTPAFAGPHPPDTFPYKNHSKSSLPYNDSKYLFEPTPQFQPKSSIPGQGGTNPLSLFVNHQVVIAEGTYYDPSYGGESFGSEAAMYGKAIAGHGYRFYNSGAIIWEWEFATNP